MKNQFFALVISHFKELSREPAVLFWGIAFPILMSWGLGVAFTKKGDTLHSVAIIENANRTTSELYNYILKNGTKKESALKGDFLEIKTTNEKTGNTIYHFNITSWDSAIVLLKRGNINLILEPKNGETQYHYDPLNPEGQLLQYKLEALLHPEQLNEMEANAEPLSISGTRYIDFLIPGLIAMGVMMSCMWGISYNLVEKRKLKLLRRMVATPMKKSNFLAALIGVRVSVNLIESALLFVFALFYFNIKIQGSIAALLLLFLAGNIAFAGIAVFVSSRTSKSEVGNGLINAIVTPMMVLSGIFFSYQNFPEWSIPAIQAMPLTLLADNIRAIFNEGAGIIDVIKPTIILSAIGFLFFGAGLKIFKWY